MLCFFFCLGSRKAFVLCALDGIRVQTIVAVFMNRNVEIWCAWPKCQSNLMWICIEWTTNWCLRIPNTSMTGQTWWIKLQIYRRMYVCGVRKMLHRSIVVVVCLFFYVIIYIFSRCVCAYTIIDRSACTEERKTFFFRCYYRYACVSVVGCRHRCHRNRNIVVHYKYQSSKSHTIQIQRHAYQANPSDCMYRQTEKKAKRPRMNATNERWKRKK